MVQMSRQKRTNFPPDRTASSNAHLTWREGVKLPMAFLLIVLVALAQLWFGLDTASACLTLEGFPCGP